MNTTAALLDSSVTDVDLVAQSQRGSRDAFAHIVARYQSLICSIGYSVTGSLSRSEDVAQETFLSAWRRLDDLRDPASLIWRSRQPAACAVRCSRSVERCDAGLH